MLRGTSCLVLLAAACGTASSNSGGGGPPGSGPPTDASTAEIPDVAPTPDSGMDASLDAAGPHLVTVFDFNLLHGYPDFKDLDARTKIDVDFIKAENPDFIFFQEAGQTPTQENRASVIAKQTG